MLFIQYKADYRTSPIPDIPSKGIPPRFILQQRKFALRMFESFFYQVISDFLIQFLFICNYRSLF